MLYPPVLYMKTYGLYFSFHSYLLFFRTIFHTHANGKYLFPKTQNIKKYLLANVVFFKRTQLFDINQIKRNIWKFSLYSLCHTIFLTYLCSVKRERHYSRFAFLILTTRLNNDSLSNQNEMIVHKNVSNCHWNFNSINNFLL